MSSIDLEPQRAGGARRRARLAQLRAAHGRRRCAGASSSSTSGRTRASTGCGRCRTSGRGTSGTATAGSSSSACTRPSSGSSTTSTTCAARCGELGVGYPVVIDNDFAIWRSFDNHYWPAVYLVDGDGRVRFHHFGEGAYEETERAIQQLLGVDEATVERRRRRPGRGGRLGHAAVAGDLPRPRARRAPQRRARRRARAQPVGARRRLVGGRGGRRARRRPAARSRTASRRATSTSSSRRRPRAPRSASPCASTAGRPATPTASTSTTSGEGTVAEPRMYQLVRQPADAAAAHVRDHVPRPGRARLRLHLRLTARGLDETGARS